MKWSSRSCVQQKHYICHTKLKVVGNKGKKKLRRQYNADKYNKLNEIPVPTIPDYLSNSSIPLKANIPISYKVEINNSLNDQALFAESSPELVRKVKKNKRKRKTKKYRQLGQLKQNATKDGSKLLDNVKNTKYKGNVSDNGKPTSIQHIRWRTYKKELKQANPLYPKTIVEEYNYVKER
ncbi:hypothetical protein NQ314_004906 [Rhamnusium bicolor]|uniref:Uncharacterized protein n=1 Tax=Rhamnusium bicolor TaxID=1586634 RepID=A0AAV8ZID5_9CUCU|nr:hypothetical protein NQ314_004906 [Rhamnusium bicolor]